MSRAKNCPYPYNPKTPEPPKVKQGEVANTGLGLAVHSARDYMKKQNKPPRLEDFAATYKADPAEVRQCFDRSQRMLDDFNFETYHTEVPFMWLPGGEVKLLKGVKDREYSSHPDYQKDSICMTIDLIGRGNGITTVLDWKFGAALHVPPIDVNMQLLLGAYCVWKHEGVTQVEIALAFPGDTLRKNETLMLDQILLERAGHTIQAVWDRTRNSQEAHAGEHCSFCPYMGACPATNEALAAAVPELDTVGWSAEITSMEQATKMADQLSVVKKAVDAISDSLKAYADEHGGIPLPDGKVWKAIEVNRKNLNRKALIELVGQEAIDRCTHKVSTKQYRRVKP